MSIWVTCITDFQSIHWWSNQSVHQHKQMWQQPMCLSITLKYTPIHYRKTQFELQAEKKKYVGRFLSWRKKQKQGWDWEWTHVNLYCWHKYLHGKFLLSKIAMSSFIKELRAAHLFRPSFSVLWSPHTHTHSCSINPFPLLAQIHPINMQQTQRLLS